MANGLHQVGFAQPDGSMQEKWIEVLRRSVGDTAASRMCKSIARADYELLKVVIRFED